MAVRQLAFPSSMFLDFAKEEKTKRIAYAASFGTDQWEFTQEMTSICAPLAQKFDFVSVREDSGVKLCKEHLGVNAVHVLDPTLLLTKEDYIHLIEAEKEPKAKGTLFNYILDPDYVKSAFINLDSRNREFMSNPDNISANVVAEMKSLKSVPAAEKYLSIRDKCQAAIDSGLS